jgi:hypothetical protein
LDDVLAVSSILFEFAFAAEEYDAGSVDFIVERKIRLVVNLDGGAAPEEVLGGTGRGNWFSKQLEPMMIPNFLYPKTAIAPPMGQRGDGTSIFELRPEDPGAVAFGPNDRVSGFVSYAQGIGAAVPRQIADVHALIVIALRGSAVPRHDNSVSVGADAGAMIEASRGNRAVFVHREYIMRRPSEHG